MTDNTRNNTMTLHFSVTEASVTQSICILSPDYSKQRILDGLNDGSLATTMWHSRGPTYIDNVATGQSVALILSQELDGCYEDFE